MLLKRHFSGSIAPKFLKKPCFDVKAIINSLPAHQTSIVTRELIAGKTLLENLNLLPSRYEHFKTLNKQVLIIQSKRKAIESLIKVDKSKTKELQADIIQLKSQYNDVFKEIKMLKDTIDETCSSLPNLVHTSVPLTEPDIVHWINPRDSYVPDELRDHVTIMTKKGMVDFQTASNVTGNSWYYLMNKGAQLEYALVSYALEKALASGFNMCLPPSIARNEVINACGFRPKDMNNEQQIYHINNTDLGLIATAEITLAGLGINQVLDLSQGPKKLVGVSRSYRAEAGARGRDTKGLYRVHEFTKVELFCWSKPAESEKVFEQLKDFQIDLVESLGLTAKVLNMPSNDLGAPAYKKYDIEAWMPGRGSFGEISSTSNCTQFQSRRMLTKYKNTELNSLEYVHTLNGTAMAVPRVLLAIVENFYDPHTEKIHVPEPLRKYMGGDEYI